MLCCLGLEVSWNDVNTPWKPSLLLFLNKWHMSFVLQDNMHVVHFVCGHGIPPHLKYKWHKVDFIELTDYNLTNYNQLVKQKNKKQKQTNRENFWPLQAC